MAFFKRRKQNTELPQEVRNYYQTERRERTGVAWLLAVGTLLVTFFIAAALFFSGRWAYRVVFEHNRNKTQTTGVATGTTASPQPSSNEANSSQSSGNSTSGGSSASGVSSTQNSSTNSTGGSSASSSSTGTTNSSNAASVKPATTPNTGPSQLINTGPGDE